MLLDSHCCIFFFFKQKTAYEMRISDWSSDVCSSDRCLAGSPLSRGAIDARMGVPAWWHDRVDRAFLYALHYRKHIPDIDAVPHIAAPRHPSLPCSGRPAPCTRCSPEAGQANAWGQFLDEQPRHSLCRPFASGCFLAGLTRAAGLSGAQNRACGSAEDSDRKLSHRFGSGRRSEERSVGKECVSTFKS